jgi:hypothetical protein
MGHGLPRVDRETSLSGLLSVSPARAPFFLLRADTLPRNRDVKKKVPREQAALIISSERQAASGSSPVGTSQQKAALDARRSNTASPMLGLLYQRRRPGGRCNIATVEQ